jgi:hypothetical protein
MNNRVDYWVNRFFGFDIYTDHSDDYSVVLSGRDARYELSTDLKTAELTDSEKLEILEQVGRLSDARYIANLERYSCAVKKPLWNEGAGPDLKRFVKSYLEV